MEICDKRFRIIVSAFGSCTVNNSEIFSKRFTEGTDKESNIEVSLKKKIKKFCRKFDRIYIYGAGIKARRYTKYLNEMGIPFEGYLVSGPPNNIAGFDHHKVQTFCMDILYGCSAGILLALNEKNTVEVLKSVLKFVDKKKIFTDFSSKILFSAGGDC